MSPAEILAAFPKRSMLVVGDICLDRWCTYSPDHAEASRETGLPRIAVVSTEVTPGAGGTVAANAASLEIGNVAVLGAIGDDGFGYELTQALAVRRISASHLVRSRSISTFTYTKLIHEISRIEDKPRVDFINTRPLPQRVEEEVIQTLRRIHSEFDVIIAADQAETACGGVVTPRLREALSEIARARPEAVIWADSRMRLEHFRNVTLKVNSEEADAACMRLNGSRDYQKLRHHIAASLLIVTRGPEGVLLVTEDGEQLVAGRPVSNPVDVCGAGDSFTAGAACALAVGASLADAAGFGNTVASITVMKPGTGTATPAEILSTLTGLVSPYV